MANEKDGKNGKLLYFPGCDKPPAMKFRIIRDVLPLYEALSLIGESTPVGAGTRIMLESEHERARKEIGLVFDSVMHHHAWSMRGGSLDKNDPDAQADERVHAALPLAAFLMETIEKIFPKVLESGDAGTPSLFWAFQDRVKAFLSTTYYFKPIEQSIRVYLDELEPMISALMKSCGIEGTPLPVDAMPHRYGDAIDTLIREKIEMFNRYQRI